jgi:predicted lipoprotein with Yx(FWY)xxD motif
VQQQRIGRHARRRRVHDRGHLVGPGGRTLYYNTVDSTTKITCVGRCATEWPPLTGTPRAGAGLSATSFGTAARPDGRQQVTFDGHPLYEFAGDRAAGQTAGNGIADAGGRWMVATPKPGAAPAPSSSATSSSASSPGGGGYGY